MSNENSAQVALLLDFENLVFGLENIHGDSYTEEMEPELLFKLAEEYGHVVLAGAYADWRNSKVNQFQKELYRLGIDLIHVMGKMRNTGNKNAVDVKMAVDAIEIIWTLPHVKTFVIVSGDRDFIHVLKTLRRYGRKVIGVSPGRSASEDYAALCDRFIRYGALASTYRKQSDAPTEENSTDKLEDLRDALKRIMVQHPSGLKGAQIKPLLRRELTAKFDESEYGFSRMSDLLSALSDIVKVETEKGGSDLNVYPVDGRSDKASSPKESKKSSSLDSLIEEAGLQKYKYNVRPGTRRRILKAFYEIMKDRQSDTLSHIFEDIIEEYDDLNLTVAVLSRYQTMLWHARVFDVKDKSRDIPIRERKMSLDPAIKSAQDLIKRYEANIIFKINQAAEAQKIKLETKQLCQTLGLPASKDQVKYCEELIKLANTTA